MPLFATLLAGLFASIAEFFGKYLSKKLAFAAAAIAVFSGLTASLGLALSLLVTQAYIALPAVPGLQIGFWLVVTDNVPFIISGVISIDSAIALYRWNVENLKLASYIT